MWFVVCTSTVVNNLRLQPEKVALNSLNSVKPYEAQDGLYGNTERSLL